MKRTFLLVMLGLTTSMSPAVGQGCIRLDNYDSSGPIVTYGVGTGPVGTGLDYLWSVGLYYALGDVRGDILADPSGILEPSLLGPLVLGTGSGCSAIFDSGWTASMPGYFSSGPVFSVPGGNPGDIITLMVVAYEGASYQTTIFRGHSTAFTMILAADGIPAFDNSVGYFMPGFSVYAIIPEPGTLVLAVGCGLASLTLWWRRH